MVWDFDRRSSHALWRLRASGVRAVLDGRGPGLPQVLH